MNKNTSKYLPCFILSHVKRLALCNMIAVVIYTRHVIKYCEKLKYCKKILKSYLSDIGKKMVFFTRLYRFFKISILSYIFFSEPRTPVRALKFRRTEVRVKPGGALQNFVSRQNRRTVLFETWSVDRKCWSVDSHSPLLFVQRRLRSLTSAIG